MKNLINRLNRLFYPQIRLSYHPAQHYLLRRLPSVQQIDRGDVRRQKITFLIVVVGTLALYLNDYILWEFTQYYGPSIALLYASLLAILAFVMFIVCDLGTLMIAIDNFHTKNPKHSVMRELALTTTLSPYDFVQFHLNRARIETWWILNMMRYLRSTLCIPFIVLMIIATITSNPLYYPTHPDPVLIEGLKWTRLLVFSALYLFEPGWRMEMLLATTSAAATRFKQLPFIWALAGLIWLVLTIVEVATIIYLASSVEFYLRQAPYNASWLDVAASWTTFAITPGIIYFMQQYIKRFGLYQTVYNLRNYDVYAG